MYKLLFLGGIALIMEMDQKWPENAPEKSPEMGKMLFNWPPGWQFNSIKKVPENLWPFFGPFFRCIFCPIESGLKFP